MPSKYPEFGGRPLRSFYTLHGAPVHSVMLLRSREEALAYPCGAIDLAFCEDDGFVTNVAFDHTLQHYDENYEETQGYSETFTRFHERLARQVIERFDLRGKRIVEIGCGKGDFLNMLCAQGDNTGVGYDPAYRPDRDPYQNPRVRFVRELYSEGHGNDEADFICCKMTLEHIPDVVRFVTMVRNSIPAGRPTTVFFQIPELRRVLTDVAFWDIYYEHCSYFTQGSLARIFRKSGFLVRDLWTDYDDQYLMIEAVPAPSVEAALAQPPLPQEESVEALAAEVRRFEQRFTERLGAWRSWLQERHQQGQRIALWGGGSKAVAFLTTLAVGPEVTCAVDINPHKAGTWLAGTGQPVVAPARLRELKPDHVIVMNPIYRAEIAQQLRQLDLEPELVMIDADLSRGVRSRP